jgi:hypothetical protein
MGSPKTAISDQLSAVSKNGVSYQQSAKRAIKVQRLVFG